MDKILNIDFVVKDKESFTKNLDELERNGIISKYEIIFEDGY